MLSLYSVCGWILSMFLAWRIYPYVNQFLLNSFVYDFVYGLVEANLGLDEMIAEKSASAQNALIEGLALPAFLIGILQSGNNPVLHELFKAANIAEYIYAYLTVIFINMLSIISAFIIISIILRALLRSLNIVTRLPIVNTLNRFGGIAAGAVQGLLVTWIAGLVITGLIAMGSAPWLGDALEGSLFAHKFVDVNFLINIVFNLTNIR
jgi:uncharacterized membrane protein required for colicin V production